MTQAVVLYRTRILQLIVNTCDFSDVLEMVIRLILFRLFGPIKA